MENSQSPITPGMSFNLTKEELFQFQKKSEDGDVKASEKLWLFYEFAVRDRVKAEEWLEKAAEQGLTAAQHNLAVGLSRRGSPQYDLEKAKYWTTKAANGGEKLARGLLQQIEKLEEPGNSK
jgi:TPR repeat protein